MQAFNFSTMVAYGGRNAGLVSNREGTPPAFATFLQLKSMGYSVRKGAKSVSIFCGYRPASKKDLARDASAKSVPIYARVFDIADTSAIDDTEYLQWLAAEVKAGRVAPSAQQVDAEIVAAVLAPAKRTKTTATK